MSLALCYWNGGFAVQLGLKPPMFDRPYDPPVPPTVPVEAGPDTTLSFPTETDQCWDAALLCTPSPGKTTLRDPDDVSAGFLPAPAKNKR